MDWIGSCAGAPGASTPSRPTPCRARTTGPTQRLRAEPVLTGEADLKTTPQQVVTYHINPKAVWSDGQPITSTDFKYTWDQIAHGKDIYDKTGYSTSRVGRRHRSRTPRSSPSPRRTRTGRSSSAATTAIFPSHLLQGKDRDAIDEGRLHLLGRPVEARPLDQGHRDQARPQPHLLGQEAQPEQRHVQVHHRHRGRAAGLQVRPGPGRLPAGPARRRGAQGQPGTSFDAITGLSFEALWFNVEKAPLNDAKRCARRWPTPPTATPSSSSCSRRSSRTSSRSTASSPRRSARSTPSRSPSTSST